MRAVVDFLASPEAGWATGQVLGVNGGALPADRDRRIL